MIIDDAPVIRLRIRYILEEHPYIIAAEAKNGEEGIDLYKKINPDIVTLDMCMPQQGGLSTLEEIMKIDPNANVIIVSAVGQKKLIVKAMSLGAKDFIIKPFDSFHFLEVLDRY